MTGVHRRNRSSCNMEGTTIQEPQTYDDPWTLSSAIEQSPESAPALDLINNLQLMRRKAGVGSQRRKRHARHLLGIMSRQPGSALMLLLLILCCKLVKINAQIGVTTCACSPSVYTLGLNLANTCADKTVTTGPGITAINCTINPPIMGNVNDYTITSVQVLELDQSLRRLSQTIFTNPLKNGDLIQFDSFIADPNAVMQQLQIPRVLNIAIIAQYGATSVYMEWTITFSNSCQSYPVLYVNQRIAWTNFVSFSLGLLPRKSRKKLSHSQALF